MTRLLSTFSLLYLGVMISQGAGAAGRPSWVAAPLVRAAGRPAPGARAAVLRSSDGAVAALSDTNHVVHGKVIDEDTKQPVQGVSVTIEGSDRGVVTDAGGLFTIRAGRDQVIILTSIGYEPIRVKAGALTNVRVFSLKSLKTAMNDVVVVGYGTQKKATLTGSVSVVDAKAFQDKGPVDNPIGALQGQVPGVVVTRTSTEPGRQNWNFQMRGATSTNGADPLVIIDGIPVSSLNALNSINPNDIDNMSFLKDADAAIYGARGAGGVVLITTKRGKSGKPTIQYDGSVSKKVLGLMPHLLDVKPYGQMMMAARIADNYGTVPTSDSWYQLGVLYANAPDSGWISGNSADPGFGDVADFPMFQGMNWQKVLWGNATSTQQNIAISGRGTNSGYRVSLGYMDDGSQLQWGDNSNKRYNLRLAHDYTFSEKLKVETNISLEENNIVEPTMLSSALGPWQQPGFPSANKYGLPYTWGGQRSVNWQLADGGDNKEYDTRLVTSTKLTYAFTPHLHFIGSAGYNATFSDNKAQQKGINWYSYAGTTVIAQDPSQVNTYYQRGLNKDLYYNANAYLEYRNTFSTVHDLGLTLGTSYERDETDAYTTRSTDLQDDNVPSLGLVGSSTVITNGESQSHWALGSYFGRFNYAYKNKYLFEANARYDGSSKFIASNRWKAFYGLSGGWRLTEETFMKHQKVFNELKLRASYGSVGNQNGIGLYDYIQLLNVSQSTGATNSGYPVIGGNPVVTVGPTNTLVSLNRTWEDVRTANLALDFSVLNHRLSGTIEYFVKNNIGMLLAHTYSAILGATAPASNSGHLRTWGKELSLMWQDRIGPVTYHIGGNISDNQNKLVSFGGQKVIASGYNNAVEGQPIGAYFGLQYAGRIQTQAQLDAYNTKYAAGNSIGMPAPSTIGSTTSGLRLGDNMFKDLNGDGKLTLPGDLKYLGRNDPRWSYSFNLGAEWKGFDFSVVFQGVGQRTIYRRGYGWGIPFYWIWIGQSSEYYNNTWTPTNTNAKYPTLATLFAGNIATYNYQPSTWSVENGAYLRLKNLVIGYTLPQAWTQKAKIQKLRIYFSGNDLWEISHINDGWDPEATMTISGNERFPFYRFLTGGINLTF
ncbi:SusC/RagA family TonB-linked outer membrane protein [Dinghuibacter silviterrae]|uniref:TonB-linked SusC/RagA family outer membrane protein n=1 Tax=Dinghuibacter silviterrae TaxID=1539049 RepID=A0A4R8DGY8_9BACT|nr:TonB-dependent receptor [Dinghuibacter silviterrae]TDW96951.1 TonB-linked SusC/RagA family outer membrane protein [Dinghuibacter silviterrae]